MGFPYTAATDLMFRHAIRFHRNIRQPCPRISQDFPTSSPLQITGFVNFQPTPFHRIRSLPADAESQDSFTFEQGCWMLRKGSDTKIGPRPLGRGPSCEIKGEWVIRGHKGQFAGQSGIHPYKHAYWGNWGRRCGNAA